jgi:hypothetical protein
VIGVDGCFLKGYYKGNFWLLLEEIQMTTFIPL